MRLCNTNLHRLGRDDHIPVVFSEEGSVVDIGRDRVIIFLHDIVVRVIAFCDREIEEIILVIACLFEDSAPIRELFICGLPNIVQDKT